MDHCCIPENKIIWSINYNKKRQGSEVQIVWNGEGERSRKNEVGRQSLKGDEVGKMGK